jgi:hypothetical protein
MPLRIFLDSRDWITLAKIVDGKEKNPELVKIYEKIKKLSNSKHFIFPFSLYHLDDIMKRSDKKSRDKVIDVMIDISKGWVMKPYNLFYKKEIENALLNRLGKYSIHDIQSQIFSIGIAYTAGEEYYISSSTVEGKKFLDEHGIELHSILDSIDSMEKLLKNDSFVHSFQKWKKPYEQLAIKLEKNREYKRKMTKSKRYDYELAAYFSGSITPHIVRFLQEFQIPPEKIRLTTKSDVNSFLENMPSINVFFKLIFARDEESPERKVQSNDMVDICHLAGAIPYCDIVVVEKMFSNLSKKQQLDKKYNCIMCSSLLELNSILSS